MTQVLQSIFTGLAIGAVFSIVGLGFVIVHRVTGVVNFAQGAFAASGAFLMSSLLGPLPWPIALVLAVVLGALLSTVVGFGVIAGRGSHGVPALMVTLGVAIILEGVFTLAWGDTPVSYAPVASGSITIGGAALLPQQLFTAACLLAVFASVQLFFARSYLGKALTAAALNPTAARLTGMNLTAIGTVAFAVSGAVSAIAGALIAPLAPVTPGTHLALAVDGFTAAVIGNLFSPVGTAIGGLLLGQLQGFAANYGLAGLQEETSLAALLVVLLIQAARAR